MARKRGYEVQVILPATLLSPALESLPQLKAKLADFGVIGVAKASDGNYLYLCHEGVHWWSNDESLEYVLSKYPNLEVKDSADFVRTFGSRLDVNHYLFTKHVDSGKGE